jgi:hypothetical protein
MSAPTPVPDRPSPESPAEGDDPKYRSPRPRVVLRGRIVPDRPTPPDGRPAGDAGGEAPGPNVAALEILEEVRRRQEGRRETDGSGIQDAIREARSGAMYGNDPDPSPAALRAQAEDYRAKWEDALVRLDAVIGTLALYGRRAEAGRELARAFLAATDAIGPLDIERVERLRDRAASLLARPIGGRDGGETPGEARRRPSDAMPPAPADPGASDPADATAPAPRPPGGPSPDDLRRRIEQLGPLEIIRHTHPDEPEPYVAHVSGVEIARGPVFSSFAGWGATRDEAVAEFWRALTEIPDDAVVAVGVFGRERRGRCFRWDGEDWADLGPHDGRLEERLAAWHGRPESPPPPGPASPRACLEDEVAYPVGEGGWPDCPEPSACRRCGATGDDVRLVHYSDGRSRVECTECGTTGGMVRGGAAALAAWDRRAEAAPGDAPAAPEIDAGAVERRPVADDDLDDLIERLDRIARDTDSYEYGLPTGGHPGVRLRAAVHDWLISLGLAPAAGRGGDEGGGRDAGA